MICRFFLIFITTLIVFQAKSGCDELVPNSEDWNFARLILNSSSSKKEKISQFKGACDPFDTQDYFWTTVNSYSRDRVLDAVLRAWTFSDIFRVIRGTNLKDEYMAELLKIKSNPSAEARVQLTYELLLRYRLPHDHTAYRNIANGNLQDRRLILRPGEVLSQPAICRDLTRLLKYSLDVVSAPKTDQGWSPVFTSQVLTGMNSIGGHTWVNVRIPQVDEQGRIAGFRNISLDPTSFTTRYVPLPQLAQKIPKKRRQKLFQKCTLIKTCLNNSVNGVVTPTTLNLAPSSGLTDQ